MDLVDVSAVTGSADGSKEGHADTHAPGVPFRAIQRVVRGDHGCGAGFELHGGAGVSTAKTSPCISRYAVQLCETNASERLHSYARPTLLPR